MAKDDPAALSAQILTLGREGKGRAEIAAALGVSLQRLRTMEAETPDVGAALRVAETAAQGWWEQRQREALLEGAHVNVAAWRSAMEWRFGDAKGRSAAAARAPLARYEIPDNGKERKPRRPRR
jgi:hypothetical protein